MKRASLTRLPQISGIFRGHELTRKETRLSSGLSGIDRLLEGGIVRGRVSELVGRAGSGKTSLAACFLANVTRGGEVAAWIDSSGAFDPMSMQAAGVDPRRVLWVHPRGQGELRSHVPDAAGRARTARLGMGAECRAAEIVLKAGGFGLVVIDFGDLRRLLPQAAALRLARAAEQSAAAVLILAAYRMCGTFAALTLDLRRIRMRISRPACDAPALFDGLESTAGIARNKLGSSGNSAVFSALIDPCGIGADPASFAETGCAGARRHRAAALLNGGGTREW